MTHLQVGERNTIFGIVCLGQEEIPEAEFARFHLQLLENRDLRLPAKHGVSWKLSSSNLDGGSNLLLRSVDKSKWELGNALVGTNPNKIDQFGKSLFGIRRELILYLGSAVVTTKSPWFTVRHVQGPTRRDW